MKVQKKMLAHNGAYLHFELLGHIAIVNPLDSKRESRGRAVCCRVGYALGISDNSSGESSPGDMETDGFHPQLPETEPSLSD